MSSPSQLITAQAGSQISDEALAGAICTVHMTPVQVGQKLRSELTALADMYRPMAAAGTVREWQEWPRRDVSRLLTGLETVKVLEETGRRVLGLRGCPFGVQRCPPDGPVVCRACAGAATPRQGVLGG